MNRDILSHKQKIDVLFQKASHISDPEIQSNLAKFLCVLISGFIEQSLRILLFEYSKNHSSLNIQRYVNSHTKGITNCKHNRILEILNSFSPEWPEKYKNEIQNIEQIPNQIKDSIDSVIANRHNIAHGKSVGMSLGTIKGHYDNIKKVILIFETIII